MTKYNAKKSKTFKDILDFHVRFERIHLFQDGNGRVGRLIMFKECLKYNIVPFIIEDNLKMFYYRGLKEWGKENGYLTDTCPCCRRIDIRHILIILGLSIEASYYRENNDKNYVKARR